MALYSGWARTGIRTLSCSAFTLRALSIVALLPLLSCGEATEGRWLLQETPRVLAFRTEVVEGGPWSGGLLPIPADRIRSEPLPGDTVELSAFVVSADGVVPDEVLEPAWFLCPGGACLSELGFPGAGEACGDVLPEEVPCALPTGPRPRFVMPGLNPELPLVEQVWPRVAFVAHAEDGPSTERCIELIGDPDRPARDGCIVGYHRIFPGPFSRLLQLALAEDVELPDIEELDPELLDVPVQPHFNPELTFMRLVPFFDGGAVHEGRVVEAYPDQVTVLEPGYAYVHDGAADPRDGQTSVGWVSGELNLNWDTFPGLTVWTDTPGIYGELFGSAALLRAPETPGRFRVFAVLKDSRGGADWATFTFEVREP